MPSLYVPAELNDSDFISYEKRELELAELYAEGILCWFTRN